MTTTEIVHASCGWCTTARCQGCVETRKTSRPIHCGCAEAGHPRRKR